MKLPEIIRAAIEIGHRNSFVTFDQLDELLLPSYHWGVRDRSADAALSDEGIDVRDE
jgi:hypothetical protein